MKILPVLDLMNGVVVRGIGGRRKQYQPIISQISASAQPLDVAWSIRTHFGLDEFYLADLDAIAGEPPSLTIVKRMLANGFRLWVDAGIGAVYGHVRSLVELGVQRVIAGLESLEGPSQLQELINFHSAERLVFSLDMHDGKALTKGSWICPEPWAIAVQAVQQGVHRMIVLDLAAVGCEKGTPTGDLCVRLRTAFPVLEIITGGGIHSGEDLRRIQQWGVNYVLIASALHDGRLTSTDVQAFS